MVNIDSTDIPQSLYPLAWLIGKFEGAGTVGGPFGITQSRFNQYTKWEIVGDTLMFNNEIYKTQALEGEKEIIEEKKAYIAETGVWKVSKDRPEALVDPQLFPIEVQITTTLEGVKAFRSTLLGVIGKGKIELVSDKIEILAPELDLANNLWREKYMFGYVNQRIMWVRDWAMIGDDDGLKSIASAGLWAVE
ncbi:hypothetical protein FACS1894125_2750 [Actinomycetota bacterium]|nr:hypothetical protein FACS1894125_2750 [Actinomycetota bacterium]